MTMTAEEILTALWALPEPERAKVIARIKQQPSGPPRKPAPLADMSDEEFEEFQDGIQQARARQPMRTP